MCDVCESWCDKKDGVLVQDACIVHQRLYRSISYRKYFVFRIGTIYRGIASTSHQYISGEQYMQLACTYVLCIDTYRTYHKRIDDQYVLPGYIRDSASIYIGIAIGNMMCVSIGITEAISRCAVYRYIL